MSAIFRLQNFKKLMSLKVSNVIIILKNVGYLFTELSSVRSILKAVSKASYSGNTCSVPQGRNVYACLSSKNEVINSCKLHRAMVHTN